MIEKKPLEFSKQTVLINHIILAVLVIAEIASWFFRQEVIPNNMLEWALAAIGLSDGTYMIKSSIENKAKIEASPELDDYSMRGGDL